MSNYQKIEASELEHGAVYEIRSRNLLVGVYIDDPKGFIGIRRKFDSIYLFTEWLNDPPNQLGTAWAMRYLGRIPDDVELVERLPGDEYLPNDRLFDLLNEYQQQIIKELNDKQKLVEKEVDVDGA